MNGVVNGSSKFFYFCGDDVEFMKLEVIFVGLKISLEL